MGTRNLTCVVKDGKFRVAQYCHSDGYLRSQGQVVVKFILDHLQTPQGLETFNKRVSETLEMSDHRVSARWRKADADIGWRILEYVYNTPNARLFLQVEFAGDSLFCEWVYVLDLDKGTFEVYKGLNKYPVPESERFANFERGCNQDYYPVKLVYSLPLADVNENTIRNIEETIYPTEEKVDEIEEELNAEEVAAQELHEAPVGLDVRTKTTIGEGIISRITYSIPTTIVEYEPGNGTKYVLSIQNVSPETALSYSVGLCGESGWIVTHLNNTNAKPMVGSYHGVLFPSYWADKANENLSDAYVIAELVANEFGIKFKGTV